MGNIIFRFLVKIISTLNSSTNVLRAQVSICYKIFIFKFQEFNQRQHCGALDRYLIGIVIRTFESVMTPKISSEALVLWVNYETNS